MRPEEAEKALRQCIRVTGKSLKQLGAKDVLRIATDLWLATSIDGLRPDEGDGLVAYFELLNRRKIVFEFGINRVLRIAENPDAKWHAWSPAWKLRLSLGFTPTLEVFKLGPPVPINFACWQKSEVNSFIGEIERSAAFQLVTKYDQYSSSIALSEFEGPSGEVCHPTQGVLWATA